MNEDVRVLFEDNHILAVEKPPGLLSQGDRTGDRTLSDWAKDYLKEKYNKPGDVYLGLVHRLDRPTGGVMVLCRTSKAAARVSEQFRQHQVRKTYLAICKGRPRKDSAELVHHLLFDEKSMRAIAEQTPVKGSKLAQLSYKVLRYCPRTDSSLLSVEPRSGRKHQIRVQLSTAGYPLIDDVKYSGGGSKGKRTEAIGLWAHKISLTHPVKKTNLTLSCIPDASQYQMWSSFQETMSSLPCREGVDTKEPPV